MRGPTKTELERRCKRAEDEANALRFVIERQLSPVFEIASFASESDPQAYVPFRGARIRYFGADRADGGVIWIEEQLGGRACLSAFGYYRFVDWITESASPSGPSPWLRDLIARIHTEQSKAFLVVTP